MNNLLISILIENMSIGIAYDCLMLNQYIYNYIKKKYKICSSINYSFIVDLMSPMLCDEDSMTCKLKYRYRRFLNVLVLMYKHTFNSALESGFKISYRSKNPMNNLEENKSLIYLDQVNCNSTYLTIHHAMFTNTCRVTILKDKCNFQINEVIDQNFGEICIGIVKSNNFITEFISDDFVNHFSVFGSLHCEDIISRFRPSRIMTKVNRMIYNYDEHFADNITSEIFSCLFCSIIERVDNGVARQIIDKGEAYFEQHYIGEKIFKFFYQHYLSTGNCVHEIMDPAVKCNYDCELSVFFNMYGPITWKQRLEDKTHTWSNYNSGSINRFVQEIR